MTYILLPINRFRASETSAPSKVTTGLSSQALAHAPPQPRILAIFPLRRSNLRHCHLQNKPHSTMHETETLLTPLHTTAQSRSSSRMRSTAADAETPNRIGVARWLTKICTRLEDMSSDAFRNRIQVVKEAVTYLVCY